VTFSIFSCFLHIQLYFKPPDKAVILSEAPHRSIANRGLYSAESKDPGDACWQMLLGAFRPQTTPEDKKVTNSERSASQIYRVTQRSVARSRRTPKVLILPTLFESFRPPKPENRISSSCSRPQGKTVAGSARCGLRWLKRSEQHGYAHSHPSPKRIPYGRLGRCMAGKRLLIRRSFPLYWRLPHALLLSCRAAVNSTTERQPAQQPVRVNYPRSAAEKRASKTGVAESNGRHLD
jgi:hypothetical protein